MSGRFTTSDYGTAIAAFCGSLVFAALLIEHTLPDMDPCPLCLMQRLWFLVAGLVAYVGLAHNPRWGIYPLLTIVAALVGGGFAIRQLWLQGLPPGAVGLDCMPSLNWVFEMGDFAKAFTAMFYGTKECTDEPPLLGIAIPWWSLAGFIVVIAAAALQWRARR